MDTTLALMMCLMDRMDASDARQAAVWKELQAFHAAAPAGLARAAVASHRGACPAPRALHVQPPPPPSEPSDEESVSLSPGCRATVPTLDTLK